MVSRIDGPLSTLTSGFATNWPGGAYDPETHTAYIYSQSGASPLLLGRQLFLRDPVPLEPGAGDGRRAERL